MAKRLYPHTRLLRKEYLPTGSVKLTHVGRHKKGSLAEDPSADPGAGYWYGSVKKKGGKRELPNSAIRRGLEASVGERMRGGSPQWMVGARDYGKEAKLAKRINLQGVGMAHWGVPQIIAKKVKHQTAHNLLTREGFTGVPGSSRYTDRFGNVGRIKDTGSSKDEWNVEIERKPR